MPLNETDSIERSDAVIERVAALLFAFSVQHPERPLNELARAAGLPPSTARRLLTQLTQAGLVQQDPVSRRYSLTLRFAQLGAVALERVDLVRVAQPVMQELVDRVEETAVLAQLTDQRVLFLAITHPTTPVRVSFRVGDTRPAHLTAVGKVLLAALEPEALEHRLSQPLKAPSRVDTAALRQELDQVRAAGYAFSRLEAHREFVAVAAPVRDHQLTTVGSLCLMGPVFRIPEARLEALKFDVLNATSELSRKLGAPIPPNTGRA